MEGFTTLRIESVAMLAKGRFGGVLVSGARLPDGLLNAQRAGQAHTRHISTLLILGAAALVASAAAAVIRRVVIDRGLLQNRPRRVVASGPTTPPQAAYRPVTPRATSPRPAAGPAPATAHDANSPPSPLQRASNGSEPPLPSEFGTQPAPTAREEAEPVEQLPALATGEVEQLPALAGPVRLLQVTVESLDQLAAELDQGQAADTDVVLALPTGGAVVLGQPEEVIKAAQVVGGICVAASALPLASAALAEQLEQAIADTVGSPVMRCQCFPLALCGQVALVRALLADLRDGATDADRLTAAILASEHQIVLDIVSFLFHLLDGTGTDVTIVAGRAHVGGKEPLVLIDPAPDGHALASIQSDLADRGGGDLARLLRYDGAVPAGDDATTPADGVWVTQLWTPGFCDTVVRAAEVLGLWSDDFDDSSSEDVGVSLIDLIPRLFAHLEADLTDRIWPLLDGWPAPEGLALRGAAVIRQRVGGPGATPVGPPEARASGTGTVSDGMGTVCDAMGSVRLSDTYTGGALVLPDQHWDDGALPVGALTLWRSTDDDPCHVTPVTRGVKYTLRLWIGLDRLEAPSAVSEDLFRPSSS